MQGADAAGPQAPDGAIDSFEAWVDLGYRHCAEGGEMT